MANQNIGIGFPVDRVESFLDDSHKPDNHSLIGIVFGRVQQSDTSFKNFPDHIEICQIYSSNDTTPITYQKRRIELLDAGTKSPLKFWIYEEKEFTDNAQPTPNTYKKLVPTARAASVGADDVIEHSTKGRDDGEEEMEFVFFPVSEIRILKSYLTLEDDRLVISGGIYNHGSTAFLNSQTDGDQEFPTMVAEVKSNGTDSTPPETGPSIPNFSLGSPCPPVWFAPPDGGSVTFKKLGSAIPDNQLKGIFDARLLDNLTRHYGNHHKLIGEQEFLNNVKQSWIEFINRSLLERGKRRRG